MNLVDRLYLNIFNAHTYNDAWAKQCKGQGFTSREVNYRPFSPIVWLLALLFLLSKSMLTYGAAVIGTTPSSLSFSGKVYSVIDPKSLIITNVGNVTLDYTITSDSFWLTTSNITGSLAPGMSTSIMVNVETRGLEARNYNGNLVITDPSATNSPQVVLVTMCLSSPFLSLQPQCIVVSWGWNGFGQTNVPSWLGNVTATAGGEYHSLASQSDGTVAVWGGYDYGETNVPMWLTNVLVVTSGRNHSLALRSDGTVSAWGDNSYGQTDIPEGMTNIVAVAGGGYRSLALKSDGTVVAWGANDYGQTDVPPLLSNVVAAAAGWDHSLALKSDGTIVAWGRNDYGQTDVPLLLSNVIAVAAGWCHSLALTSDGNIVAWGRNDEGQTDTPEGMTNIVSVSAGACHSLALRSDGTVVAWGGGNGNDHGQANVPIWLSNVVAVAAGALHSLALVPADPLVVSSIYGSPIPEIGTNWLIQNTPQTCVAPQQVIGTTQYVCTGWIGSGSITNSGTSNSVTFVITNSSTLTWLWSTNYWLQAQINGGGTVSTGNCWCANGSNITMTASNLTGYSFLGWRGDAGDCVISDKQITIPITGPRSITADFTGGNISVAPTNLTFSGEIYAAIPPKTITITNTGDSILNYTFTSDTFWLSISNATGSLPPGVVTSIVVQAATLILPPRNYDGRLVIADPNATNSPHVVTVNMLLTSPYLTLQPPSCIVAWGDNAYGQTNVPLNLTNVIAVTAGSGHSIALQADGTVTAWGRNDFGQTDVPVGLTNVIAIGAGTYHSLAAREDGTVVAWGWNACGQTNVPESLTNVVAVAGGFDHSLALKSDGTIIAWGGGSCGETTIPEWLTNAVAVAAVKYHSFALRSDGTVVAWDYDFSEVTNAVAVVGGNLHSMVLKADGTVVAKGYNYDGQINVPTGLTNAVAVAAGGNHSLALRSDGTVIAWGSQTNVPVGLASVVAVACGDEHSLALMPTAPLFVSSERGSPTPSCGTNWLIRNAMHTCTVTQQIITFGTTQYVSSGWAGSGSVPVSGTSNSVSFIITNNSTITWTWNTNYWISIQSRPSGYVTPLSGWYAKDSPLSCQAFPTNYCTFNCWTNFIISTNNPLNFTVTSPAQLQALYIEEMTTNTPTPKWWLAQYGWATNFESAVMSDTDNDGLRAWQEYLADTDPTSPTSQLVITDLAIETDGIRILWSGGQNSFQFLEKSDHLDSDNINWIGLFTNLPPTPASTNYLDVIGTNLTRFYRIRVVR